jgi:hypothetical protein
LEGGVIKTGRKGIDGMKVRSQAGMMAEQVFFIVGPPASTVVCTLTGWFCCTKPLSSRARLLVQRGGNEAWEEVHLADNIKALVVLNLQS